MAVAAKVDWYTVLQGNFLFLAGGLLIVIAKASSTRGNYATSAELP